jgi:uncharacterized protein YegJ (DUF2314 family)
MAAVSRVLFCLAFWLTPASAQSVMEKAASDEPISIRSDDPDLREAYALARSGLQTFLTLAQAPRPDMSDFAVKVGAPSAREFLWLAPFKPHGDGFIGHVANTPRHIANLKLGDRLLFKREDIVDWKYYEGKVMKGNYTGCVLLRQQSREQQELFRRQYGLDCRSI